MKKFLFLIIFVLLISCGKKGIPYLKKVIILNLIKLKLFNEIQK